MNFRLAFMPVMLVVSLLAGCAGSEVEDEESKAQAAGEAGSEAATSAAAADAAQTQGVQAQGAIEKSPLDDPNSMLSQRVLYFAYNSADIAAENYDLIVAHGAYLADNPGLVIRLEGHADERGSREYNIALGERRALAVRSLLLLQGGKAEQMSVISYGEERPVAFGHNEASWARNRRVELVY